MASGRSGLVSLAGWQTVYTVLPAANGGGALRGAVGGRLRRAPANVLVRDLARPVGNCHPLRQPIANHSRCSRHRRVMKRRVLPVAERRGCYEPHFSLGYFSLSLCDLSPQKSHLEQAMSSCKSRRSALPATPKKPRNTDSRFENAFASTLPAMDPANTAKEWRAVYAAGARRYTIQYELRRLRFVSLPAPVDTGTIDARLADYQQGMTNFIEEIVALSASLSPTDFTKMLSNRARELDLLWRFHDAVRAEVEAYRKVHEVAAKPARRAD